MRFLAVVVCLIFTEQFQAASPTLEQAKALEEQIQKVIEDATPSVVAIVVSHQTYGGIDPKKPWQLGSYSPLPASTINPQADPKDLRDPNNVANHQFGSGIVLDAKRGYILTTNHLIDKATKIYIRTSNGKGSYADILASDTRSDLAVLKMIQVPDGLSNAKLSTVLLTATPDGRKPNLKRGSWVIALGHTLATGFSDGQPSASWGIVSGVRRKAGVRDATTNDSTPIKPLHFHESLIQTDARVALGSSGSAVLNLDGEVVGISTAIAAVSGSEASGGFTIPMAPNYRKIIGTLSEGREVEYGFLGIISDTNNRQTIRITGLSPGGPAQLGGLEVGDTILDIDGYPINEYADLLHAIGSALAGTEVPITVRRLGKQITIKCSLGKTSDSLPFIASVPPPTFHGLQIDYWSVKSKRDRIWTPGQTLPAGVAVRALEPNSAAEKRFKEAGENCPEWLITHVDGKAVANPDEFYRAMKGTGSCKLTIIDPNDRTITKTVNIP